MCPFSESSFCSRFDFEKNLPVLSDRLFLIGHVPGNFARTEIDFPSPIGRAGTVFARDHFLPAKFLRLIILPLFGTKWLFRDMQVVLRSRQLSSLRSVNRDRNFESSFTIDIPIEWFSCSDYPNNLEKIILSRWSTVFIQLYQQCCFCTASAGIAGSRVRIFENEIISICINEIFYYNSNEVNFV